MLLRPLHLLATCGPEGTLYTHALPPRVAGTPTGARRQLRQRWMIGGDRRFAHLRVPPPLCSSPFSLPLPSPRSPGGSLPTCHHFSSPSPLLRHDSLCRVSRPSHIGVACQPLEGLQQHQDVKGERDESRGASSFRRRRQTNFGVWVTRLAERRDAEGTRKRASCLRHSLPASLHISVTCRAALGRSFVHSSTPLRLPHLSHIHYLCG